MAHGTDSAFLRIRTREELASFLGIKLNILTMYAYAHYRKVAFYSSFEIGKKSEGKSRRIDAPTSQLKSIQRRIAKELTSIYEPPSCVHGFLEGRSIVSSARHHVGCPVILSLDLRDFFPSIAEKRVQGLFRAKPFSFPMEVASALTGLCCNRGSLLQGAPTSPVLSNMICMRMDKQLSSFAHARGVYYTRYADDITFSGKSSRAVNRLIDVNSPDLLCAEIRGIIRKNGFEVNAAKSHVARKTERQVVTGIVVNRKCNYPRDEYRTLRVVFENWKRHDIDYAACQYVAHEPAYKERLCGDGEDVPSAEAFRRHLRGRLEYYSMIDSANDVRSTSLERLWTMYHDRTGEKVSFAIPARAVLCIEACYDYAEYPGGTKDNQFDGDGSCFVTSDGKLVTCAHCIVDEGVSLNLPDDCECDIREPGTKRLLCSIPINHFTKSPNCDFAFAALPEELKDVPTLTIDTENRPVVNQRVRAFGMFNGAREVREQACKIDLALWDGIHFRVDAPFIKGMSGGPVVGQHGKVIGVVWKGSPPDDYNLDGHFVWVAAALKDTE